jgi:hypothetical protein
VPDVAWIQSFLEPVFGQEGVEGPGPLYSGEKRQLEPSRNGEDMRRNGGEPIPDMIKEDKQPTE